MARAISEYPAAREIKWAYPRTHKPRACPM
jgi:hypothetical protein